MENLTLFVTVYFLAVAFVGYSYLIYVSSIRDSVHASDKFWLRAKRAGVSGFVSSSLMTLNIAALLETNNETIHFILAMFLGANMFQAAVGLVDAWYARNLHRRVVATVWPFLYLIPVFALKQGETAMLVIGEILLITLAADYVWMYASRRMGLLEWGQKRGVKIFVVGGFLFLVASMGCAKKDPVTGEPTSLKVAKEIAEGYEWKVMNATPDNKDGSTYLHITIQEVGSGDRYMFSVNELFAHWEHYRTMVNGDIYIFRLSPNVAEAGNRSPYGSPGHHLVPVAKFLVK